tara:strand:+ start:259 stop:390 length:132 start_codon:yes stop_codon:yes gene_type:complete
LLLNNAPFAVPAPTAQPSACGAVSTKSKYHQITKLIVPDLAIP